MEEGLVVVALVESSLVVRVLDDHEHPSREHGSWLLVTGDLAGPVPPRSRVVARVIGAGAGAGGGGAGAGAGSAGGGGGGAGATVSAEAACAVDGCAAAAFSSLRLEVGPVRAAGDRAASTIELRLESDAASEVLHREVVRLEATTSGRIALEGADFLQTACLGFDTHDACAPVLSIAFWCRADAPDDARGLSTSLRYCGREELGDAIELRVIDEIGAADAHPRFRRYVATVPHVRAFSVGGPDGDPLPSALAAGAGGELPLFAPMELPPRQDGGRRRGDLHDLSAHPGVYALRVGRGGEVVARVVFAIGGNGLVCDSGAVERQRDGAYVMLLRSAYDSSTDGLSPSMARGSAHKRRLGESFCQTPVYDPYFAALRRDPALNLDVTHAMALEALAADVHRSVAVYLDDLRGGASGLDADDLEEALVEFEGLQTRTDELETGVPDGFALPFGDDEVTFARVIELVGELLRLARNRLDALAGRGAPDLTFPPPSPPTPADIEGVLWLGARRWRS
jgi:hypothetical protein